MGLLVNIDNGGTFTDICVRDEARVFHAKSPTTPHDLTQCFVDALRRISGQIYGEDDLGRLLRECDYLRYSTTAGTNAVVERTGTASAVLVEAGEEAEVYGAKASMGDERLWRALVHGEPLGLAVGPDGAVDADELTDKVNHAVANGAQRLVVTLRSAAAEREVKQLLLAKYPRHLLGAVPYLLSHELAADGDHARRTVTALFNSYLHPKMEHFLYGAERACKQHRLHRPLLIFRNDGDSARVAKTAAIKTWGSGPRGGLEGALAYARLYALDPIVSLDIGGTTTDIAVTVDGNIRRHTHGEVEGAPVSFPLPQMRSHGLGGSSVVAVRDGAITVGPQSMGAAPGPACFGRGGAEATLTDALLLAGVIDGERYLGGELRLDPERARAALVRAVADPLGVPLEVAVRAVIDTFAGKVGEQITRALEASGRDPATATLLAFGGGGPMITTAIAEASQIRRVIVPRMAAVFSAYGMGFTHLAHEYRSHDVTAADLAARRQELMTRARRDMLGEGVDADACEYACTFETDEGGEVAVRPDAGDPPPGAALCLRVVHALPTFAMAGDARGQASSPVESGRASVTTVGGDTVSVPVFAFETLGAGQGATGPALVRGEYLTCLVGAGWRFDVTANLDLVLEAVR